MSLKIKNDIVQKLVQLIEPGDTFLYRGEHHLVITQMGAEEVESYYVNLESYSIVHISHGEYVEITVLEGRRIK